MSDNPAAFEAFTSSGKIKLPLFNRTEVGSNKRISFAKAESLVEGSLEVVTWLKLAIVRFPSRATADWKSDDASDGAMTKRLLSRLSFAPMLGERRFSTHNYTWIDNARELRILIIEIELFFCRQIWCRFIVLKVLPQSLVICDRGIQRLPRS